MMGDMAHTRNILRTLGQCLAGWSLIIAITKPSEDIKYPYTHSNSSHSEHESDPLALPGSCQSKLYRHLSLFTEELARNARDPGSISGCRDNIFFSDTEILYRMDEVLRHWTGAMCWNTVNAFFVVFRTSVYSILLVTLRSYYYANQPVV